MLLFDGHLDLAMNALSCERDQALPLASLRERERGHEPYGSGLATVSLDEMRRGRVACATATLFARCRDVSLARKPGKDDCDWPDPSMTHAAAKGQLAYYRALERRGEVRVLETSDALAAHWEDWHSGQSPIAASEATKTGELIHPAAPLATPPTPPAQSASLPVGLIITMEGADAITQPDELFHWHEAGIRTLMLGHFGPSAYAHGTPTTPEHDGPLTDLGRALLPLMEDLAMPLDLSHLSDRSLFEAVDRFGGVVYASHSNCRAIANAPRQISDDQLRLIVERDGVVGIAIHNGMLRIDGTEPGAWMNTRRQDVTMEQAALHIDHVCQLAGDSRHVAIGSDLDGGYGTERCPADLDTIADLSKLGPLLGARGYTDEDVVNVLGGNWRRFYAQTLPKAG